MARLLELITTGTLFPSSLARGLAVALILSAQLAHAEDAVEPAWDAVAVEAAESTSTANASDEGSVLVDTRAEPLPVDETNVDAEEESLEPISQVSEYSPQPADPEPDSAPQAAVEPEVDEQEADDELVAESKEAEVQVNEAAAADSPDVAAAYMNDRVVRRATFRDLLPGESTKEDLISKWGEPSATSATNAGEVLLYKIDPFARVDVLVEQEVVEIIRIELDRQEQPARLEKRLRADEVDSVELVDQKSGDTLGIAYPEKGLMLLLAESEVTAAPTTPQFVTHIVIGRLDADAFALRAESRPAEAFELRLSDLKRAIQVDAECGYAHYLAAGLYLATGQVDSAVEAAEASLEHDSDNSAYRLRLAQVLAEQGEYDKAVIETRRVLDSESNNSVIKAKALHTMGRLASLGDASISDKAIAFHTMAIGVADQLATQPDNTDRRAAKQLLVEAHLAIAKEVSRRNYERKTEVVAQWIGRASGLAEEMIANDNGSLELRLVVARDALAALANLKPAKDPQAWVDEASETAAALLDASDDALMTARVDWLLGEAYFYALRIEHTRGKADKAISYGRKAIDQLMAGAATGDVRPSAEQLVGRLYFHLGAVNAVHKQDHEKALGWYKRAYPLLTSEAPNSKLFVPRRRGEALVSMAVSYWNQDQKDRAVELTVAGSELMEKAVQARVLDEKALAVPYGNLATMHRKLGDEDKAAEFSKLASSARGNVATASRQRTRSGDTTESQSKRSARSAQPSRRSAEKNGSEERIVR